jgi:hypothetical protein
LNRKTLAGKCPKQRDKPESDIKINNIFSSAWLIYLKAQIKINDENIPPFNSLSRITPGVRFK